MRTFAVLTVAALLLTSPVSRANELPSGLDRSTFDVSQSEFARDFGDELRERLRARESGFAAGAPGWEITQVGNIVFARDMDGSNQCSTDPITNNSFSACVGGAIEAFYDGMPNANPDFIATYLGWDIGQFFAFYSPQANDVRGIGMGHFAGQETFGNMGGLQGFIFMNSVQLYDSFGGGAQGRRLLFDLIWGQELGHRWGAFVHFDDHGTDSDAIQGRDYNNGGGHWSYFFDTDWSWMEGNDWKDNGDGSFTTDFDTFGQPGYSALDLYIMGLIPPSAVPEMFLIENPSGGASRVDPPQILLGGPATITGKKKAFTIDDVIKVEGERVPAFDTSVRRWDVNLLVILRQNDTPDSVTARMQEFEGWTTESFSRDTRELGYITTALGGIAPNGAPVAEFIAPEGAIEGKTSLFDASASSDPNGDSLSYVWDFGDGGGTYGSNPEVEHSFLKSGSLNVTLTVVDARGASTSVTQSVSIAAKKNDSRYGCGCSLERQAGTRPGAFGISLFGLMAVAGVLRRRKA